MSSDQRPERHKLFAGQNSSLRVGSILPFDVFLERDEAIEKFISAGEKILPEHLTRLNTPESPRILIRNDDLFLLIRYLRKELGSDSEVSTREGPSSQSIMAPVDQVKLATSSRRVFGSIEQIKESMMIFGNVSRAARGVDDKDQPRAQSRVRVDADFLNAIINATQKAFKEFCGFEIKSHPPRRRSDSANTFLIDVAAFTGINTQTVRGTVGLCFPIETYRYALGQAIGAVDLFEENDLYAGCGELVMRIFDLSRPPLYSLGYDVDNSVPYYVASPGMILSHIVSDPGFSIQFESPGGPFQFEVGIKTGG